MAESRSTGIEDVDRSVIIEHNMRAFLPVLCEYLQLKDLLMHLSFFPNEKRGRWLKMSNSEAVREALFYLLDECKEPGRFVELKDLVLDSKEEGYHKLSRLLDGEYVVSDENYRKILDLLAKEVYKRLDPMELIDKLLSYRTITDSDAEQIRAVMYARDRTMAIWELILLLPCRVECWFKDFMNSLIDAKLGDLAEILEPDMYKKLQLQRRASTDELADRQLYEDGQATREAQPVSLESNVSMSVDVCAGAPINAVILEDETESNVCDHSSGDIKFHAPLLAACVTAEEVNDHHNNATGELRTSNEKTEVVLYSREKDVLEGTMSNQTYCKLSASYTNPKSNEQNPDHVLFKNNFDDLEQEEGSDSLTALKVRNQKEDVANNLNVDTICRGGSSCVDDALQIREKELNIPTDSDDPQTTEDNDVELRPYQEELAKEGSDGENVIIMAPTNSGKTRTAARIIQIHLRRKKANGKQGKVIFLVENEALAVQQGKEMAKALPAYRTKVFTGYVHREQKQYLWLYHDMRDIFVATAQILVNALETKEIKTLSQYSLIIFDECHHTNSMHRFNTIMNTYMDMKFKDNTNASDLPQILGLTASLGVGGYMDDQKAMNHMKELLANHDTKFLCTVRRNVENLRQHINYPKEELIDVQKRTNDRFEQAMMEVKDKIARYMYHHPSVKKEILQPCDQFITIFCRPPGSFGTDQFLQWIKSFQDATLALDSKAARRMLTPCRTFLDAFNRALLIHRAARISDAQAYLRLKLEDEIETDEETDVMLHDLYKEFLQKTFANEPENPKLLKLQEIIENTLCKDNDARGIVFVKTVDLTHALARWINETPATAALNATILVGQNTSSKSGGMTKFGQDNALELFKDGKHKMIVATSVAEEGLDISACNLVIRYEHVTNEIVRLQSRGRARANFSRYFVVAEQGSWIIEKELKNAELEKVMNRVVPLLQRYIEENQNEWEAQLNQIQVDNRAARERKAEERRRKMINGFVRIQCHKCSTEICTSNDLRKVQGMHHVIINKKCTKKLLMTRTINPRFQDNKIQFDGDVYCADPKCRSNLGGVCEYKTIELPLLNMKRLRIVNSDGTGGRQYKQWSKANFEVQDFSVDEYNEVNAQEREEQE